MRFDPDPKPEDDAPAPAPAEQTNDQPNDAPQAEEAEPAAGNGEQGGA